MNVSGGSEGRGGGACPFYERVTREITPNSSSGMTLFSVTLENVYLESVRTVKVPPVVFSLATSLAKSSLTASGAVKVDIYFFFFFKMFWKVDL